jgi:hypothetical protein
VSLETRTKDGASFLTTIQGVELLINSVVALIAPELYTLGTAAVSALQDGESIRAPHENVHLWSSVYSGIEVIANRITPEHRDPRAAAPVYDLLVSAGTHTSAHLSLEDIKTKLSYKPCTIVALCGKVLSHKVDDWEGGERLCIAHFIRDAVHNKLKLPRPTWVSNQPYTQMMEGGFAERQKFKSEWDHVLM